MMAALAGKRILVVEDEYFVASDIARALQAEQAEVVGPAADIATGLTLLGNGTGAAIDVAVLDVNLAGELSYPLAEALLARGVPFVFLTGYDGWALPEMFRNVPRVAKPFAMPAVVARLAEVVTAHGTG